MKKNLMLKVDLTKSIIEPAETTFGNLISDASNMNTLQRSPFTSVNSLVLVLNFLVQSFHLNNFIMKNLSVKPLH